MEDKDIFMQKVETASSQQCWLWIGAKMKTGYGRFSLRGKTVLAHRASYEFFIGQIASGKFVCHHCDNPSCVNPAHLFQGTHTDNMRDCIAKNRRPKTAPWFAGNKNPAHLNPETRPRGDNHPYRKNVGMAKMLFGGKKHWTHRMPEKIMRGERCGRAVFVPAQVISIRESHATGQPIRKIAKKYGVTPRSISLIVRRLTWVHV